MRAPARLLATALLATALIPAATAPAAAAPAVRHAVVTLRGLVTDRYTWPDAHGRPRTAWLVRYGQPGGGGYALRFTYQVRSGGRWRTVVVDAPDQGDGGFGYLVSHEAYRTFDAAVCGDGSTSCTIASLHGEDDSPLARYLPGEGRTVSVSRRRAVHEFALAYPHWGTVDPQPDPTNTVTPSDPARHRRYDLPATVRWTFLAGQDEPRWTVRLDLSGAPADAVTVDLRGPYGVMDFAPTDLPLSRVEWGDRFRFQTLGGSVSTGAPWTWSTPWTGARYNLLVAGPWEMGLVQTVPVRRSPLGSGYADARGKTSDTHPGCTDAGWRLPCDWQWTYQSVQYEDLGASPSAMRKIAWGTAPYVGTTRTEDDDGEAFAGYPVATYTVRIVLARTGGARTRALAAAVR